MPIVNDPVHDSAAPLVSSEYGFPVREDVALTNAKGEPKARIEKDFRKLLSKIAAPLQRVLEPGETVFYACKGVPPLGMLEQFTMGWAMYRYYSVGLVFTDRRLLAFALTGSGTWRGAFKAVRWSEITSASTSGWLSQGLKLKMGKKTYLYGRLGMRNTAKIKKLLPSLMPLGAGAAVPDPIAPSEPRSLCGRCAQPTTPRVYSCAHCGLVFKDEKTLLLRTLIPGGAYFYVGMTATGAINGLFEAFLLFEIAIFLLSSQLSKPANGENFAVLAGYFALLVLLEKSISYTHARRFVRQFEPVRLEDTTTSASMASAAR